MEKFSLGCITVCSEHITCYAAHVTLDVTLVQFPPGGIVGYCTSLLCCHFCIMLVVDREGRKQNRVLVNSLFIFGNSRCAFSLRGE